MTATIIVTVLVIIAVTVIYYHKKSPVSNAAPGYAAKHIDFTDLVCKNETGRLGYLMLNLTNHPNAIVAAWFADSQNKMQSFFDEKGISHKQVLLAQNLTPELTANQTIIFIERHPFYSTEQNLFKGMTPQKVIRLCTMEDEFMKFFGGEKILNVMKQLGFKEDESLENSMISSSIERAQQKLEQQVISEKPATSQQEWFKINAAGVKL